MKVMTVLGTRPEIIRLSRIIPLLDGLCEHVLVHTGQNYDASLSDLFFNDLGVRPPNVQLQVRASSFAEQAAAIIAATDKVIEQERPDRILILGDTNSGLAAIPAARRRVPIYHMEAGNRCFDDRVPEELNRRLIDHASTILMPYTERSRENLVREGIHPRRIFVTGNPIREVLDSYAERIKASKAMKSFGVVSKEFFLVTLHRAENVDDPSRLGQFMKALGQVGEDYGRDVLVSVHPRTRDRLGKMQGITIHPRVRLLDPLGFFDFVHLEKNAACVLSDSGTVQEECCIFGVPNVTLRDVTERPETIDVGSNVLSGSDPRTIFLATRAAMSTPNRWTPPAEYQASLVSTQVAKIVLGYHQSGLG